MSQHSNLSEEEFLIPNFDKIPLKFDPPNLYINNVGTILNNITEIGRTIDTALELITESASDVLEVDIKNNINNLEEEYKKILEQKGIIAIYKEQLNLTKRVIKDADGDELEDSIAKAFKAQVKDEVLNYRKRSERIKFGESIEYKAFKSKIWSMKNPEEEMPDLYQQLDGTDSEEELQEELLVSREKANLKCPITATWLENPVTNKACMHTYSKSAILAYIKKKRAPVRCPVAGCPKNVNASTLRPNPDIETKVERARQRATQQTHLESEESGISTNII